MSDKRDSLISEQQLEIRELKQRLAECSEAANKIHLLCVCIGGPLNDNAKKYTKEQLGDFFFVKNSAESILEACDLEKER